MKTLLTAALFVIALSPFQVAAQSNQKVQVADCTSSGCSCSVSDLTLSEVAATLPIAIPDKADQMILVRRPDGKMGWSGMAPADIDLLYGGKGNCPLQLFDEIVPRSGNWVITIDDTDLSRCPMVTMAGMGQTGMQSGAVTVDWRGSFDPTRMFLGMADLFRWQQTGRLSWRGVLANEETQGAFARVTMTARLISPVVVRGENRFHFSMANVPGLPANAMPGGNSCLSVTSYTARWRG